jgi:glycerol-3-phosphate dehydrogenase
MVSVAGGKLTTWRLIGAQAAAAALGRSVPQGAEPVPGAAPLAAVERRLVAAWPSVDPQLRRWLASRYGLGAIAVLDRTRERPELLDPVHPDGPDIWAQVPEAVEREWAATPDDVLRGRLTVVRRGLDDAQVRERVAAMMGGP